MIPFQSILIPLFIVLKNLGLLNTLLGVGLVYVTFQLPFSVFVMRNSFDKVPRELEEAAVMDGAGQLRTLRAVMLPIVMPGVVTIGLFAFLTAWNEFFAALILLTKESSFTLPVLLNAAPAGALRDHRLGRPPGGRRHHDGPLPHLLRAAAAVLRQRPPVRSGEVMSAVGRERAAARGIGGAAAGRGQGGRLAGRAAGASRRRA